MRTGGARGGGPHRRGGAGRGAGDRGGSGRADEAERAPRPEQRRARARLAATAALRGAREEAFGALLSELRARARRASRERAATAASARPGAESRAALPARDRAARRPARRGARLRDRRRAGLAIESTAQLETLGGIEVASDDGRTVRNTVEERLANAEPALRMLFGQICPALAATHPSRDRRRRWRPSVSVASHSADFVYGNTRLRARKGALLGAPATSAARPGSRGPARGACGTAYRPDIEAAQRHSDRRARAPRGDAPAPGPRRSEEMRAFYAGRRA